MTSKHLNERRQRLQGFFACFSRLCFTQLAYAVHMGVICIQCGAQYPTDRQISCKLCEDERGSQRRDGQQWISKERLHDKHKNVLLEEERGVLSVGTEPGFGTGQRALLIQTGALSSLLAPCCCFLSIRLYHHGLCTSKTAGSYLVIAVRDQHASSIVTQTR